MPCMSAYIHVYICMYACNICIYAHAYTYTCLPTDMHELTNADIIYVYRYRPMYACQYAYINVYIYLSYIDTHTYMCTHTVIHNYIYM